MKPHYRRRIAVFLMLAISLVNISLLDWNYANRRRGVWFSTPESIFLHPLFDFENVDVVLDCEFAEGFPIYCYIAEKYQPCSSNPQPSTQFGFLIMRQDRRMKLSLVTGTENSKEHISRTYAHEDGGQYLMIALKDPASVRLINASVEGYDAEDNIIYTREFTFEAPFQRHIMWTAMDPACARYEITDVIFT